MTEQLAKAFERLSLLPPEEQDAFATFILCEVDSEARWDALFSASQDLLSEMAQQALCDEQEGHTAALDFDRDFEAD